MSDDSAYAIVSGAISRAPLKLSFLAHLSLVSWGMMGYWSRDSYIFYNLMFFLTLLWTMHDKNSVDPPLLCLLINITAIFLDFVTICIYFPKIGSADRFSAGMAILNLILRPLSSFALYKVWKERQDSLEGRTEPGTGRGYEGIAGANYGSSGAPTSDNPVF